MERGPYSRVPGGQIGRVVETPLRRTAWFGAGSRIQKVGLCVGVLGEKSCRL